MQCGNALRVGRQFAELCIAVIDAERLNPFAFMFGKIFSSEEAPNARKIGAHRAGGFACVEFVPAILADALQRVGEVWVFEQAAFGGRGREIGGFGVVVFFQHPAFECWAIALGAIRPIEGDDFRDRRASAGIFDCGREIIPHGALAEFVM